MKKVFISLFVVTTALLSTGCIITTGVAATVRFSPPVVVVVDNPELIVIPGTYVYYLSAREDDIFFYHGVWYRPYRNSWYRSDHYRGTWVAIDSHSVPRAVMYLPSNWKRNHHDAPRVRENDAHSHWHEWERDRYWEKSNWKHNNQHPSRNDRR
ncbi:MAG: hypothetical protein JW904_14665 [Spirochaetales bacterium]|nr:hypothetical protein [Spirochaetales bacterium]